MPIIKRVKKGHSCLLPLLGDSSPRSWFWGNGTEWQCRKCKTVWVLEEFGPVKIWF